MFAVAWLYFDAFLVRKAGREAIRAVGYLLLALSFIAQATIVESGLITASIIPQSLHIWFYTLTRIPGYIFIIWSLIVDPIQPKPKTEGIQESKQAAAPAIVPMLSLSTIPHLLSPLFVLTIGGMYLQRATIGLERHLKRVAVSFILLGVSEIFALRTLFTTSTNIDIYQLTAPFGLLWIIQNLVLVLSLAILCKWVFGYLLKRFETQLFMIFTVITLMIFLITTVTFTGLLVKNLVDQTLDELTVNARVLALSLSSKQQEILSDTELFAQDSTIVDAVSQADRRIIADRVTPHLLTHKLTTLIVVNKDGTVLATAEDPDRYGNSLNGDTLVQQALAGQNLVSTVAQEGTVTSNIILKAAVPIKNGSTIVGAVISGSIADTALLDGIKRATGLEASIYANTTLTATTLLSPDGVTRPIGTQEQRPQIRITVLKDGQPYTGGINLLNRPYFASYLPLLDANNTPVGMLFVGKPQAGVLSTAGRSIELTFLVTAVLLILSIVPAYLISQYIVKQIK